MAYDLTPTRNRTIVLGGLAFATALFALHFVFDSYFIQITEGEQHAKLASPEQLLKTRDAERKALASGPVTLENAMAQLARQGRAGTGGGVDVAPQQSKDIGPLTGWNKMPRAAEQFLGSGPDLAGSLANAPGSTDAGAAQVDAGTSPAAVPAHAGADAGAPLSTDGDAGSKYNPQR